MGIAVFDTSDVAPERQFELFYETINSLLVRITPEPCETTANGFAARVVSFESPGGCCHILEAPSHTALRTVRDIRSSDPEEIHLNYMMHGDRRVRIGEREFTIGAGDAFALDTRRPFDLLGTRGHYCCVKIVFPVFELRKGRPASDLTLPDTLQTHPLYHPLCATCRYLGANLEKASARELSVLTNLAGWLFQAILREENPAAMGEAPDEMFLLVSLEIDRNLADPEFDLTRLSRRLHGSNRSVQRVLERYGTTFSALLRRKRMEFAHDRLRESRCSIEVIAEESGYSGLSAFYRAFKREFGISPGAVSRPAIRPGDAIGAINRLSRQQASLRTHRQPKRFVAR